MENLRKVIRNIIIQEMSIAPLYGEGNVFYDAGMGSGPFPYSAVWTKPEEIDVKNNYLPDYSSASQNQDLYSFPDEEFKMGLQIETLRNPDMNILEVAEKVLFNLKQDSKFYTKLTSGQK